MHNCDVQYGYLIKSSVHSEEEQMAESDPPFGISSCSDLEYLLVQ